MPINHSAVGIVLGGGTLGHASLCIYILWFGYQHVFCMWYVVPSWMLTGRRHIGSLLNTHNLKQTSLVQLKQSLHRYIKDSAYIFKKSFLNNIKITFCILVNRKWHWLGDRIPSGCKCAIRVFRAQMEIQGLFVNQREKSCKVRDRMFYASIFLNACETLTQKILWNKRGLCSKRLRNKIGVRNVALLCRFLPWPRWTMRVKYIKISEMSESKKTLHHLAVFKLVWIRDFFSPGNSYLNPVGKGGEMQL